MPTLSVKDAPEKLRPYLFHRVNLTWSGTADAIGDCPFCGKEKLFFVNQTDGRYSCKICGGGLDPGKSGGNIYTFLRKLHKESTAADDDLAEVADNRKLPVAVLKEWGLVRSLIDGEWMLPAYGIKKEVNNLYRWSVIGGKRRMLTTATMEHCLFGYQFWDNTKPEVFVAEGPWDGMALRYMLSQYRFSGPKLVRTGDINSSLLATINVVAVPGCETFREEWVPLFEGKQVSLLYDNDHPKTNPKTGRVTPPAGHNGMRMAARKLSKVADRISYLAWGSEGFDPNLPDHYDIRDFLNATPALTA